ncbi:MAG TPA: PepSY-associated TM helix domain-containing protein [Verrucomicrobiae bacterium]|nr:PepSY-associated TM helix domain-containing protein [Verrucomicrobiae bacterium]
MKIRKVIFWMHLVAGVLASAVILIMSFTGICLAFETQLLNRAERNVRNVMTPAPDAKSLTYDALLEKARAAHPDTAPTGLFVRAEATASVMVNFGREDVLYLNPFTGEILGHGSKIRGLLQQIENWHRWLGAAETHRPAARAITGASNFTFLFLAVSGVYLWWPRNWNWKTLRPAVWFVRGLGGKARDWNWHNTIGFWCSPILIILTLTGTVMSYQWANNLLYRLSGNQPPPPQADRTGGNQQRGEKHRPSDAGDDEQESASIDVLLAKARQQLPAWSTLTLRLPPRAGAPVTISIQQSGAPAFYRSQLTLNSSTAEIVKWEPFAGQNSRRKLRTWVRFMHTGEAGGLIGQTIAAIASAGGVILVCTGVAMAYRRFFGKQTPAAP